MLGPLSAEAFIQQYWQKEPLLVRAAWPAADRLVDGDTLAGIACEADAEARLVLAGDDDWQCESGPFDAQRFSALPGQGWTLLVQAVDQWLPDIAGLLDVFDFLPRWRLDDIMISYAVDGGGVGPHFDHYDVFLLQASGIRRWQLGQRCDAHTPLRAHPQLKLLQDFVPAACHTLQAGDLLYVPAGLAHWGTAVGTDCITISIGFRAGSARELLLATMERLADGLPEHRRYRDTPAAIDADPWCINAAVLANLRAFWQSLEPAAIDRALVQALGCQATEPRYPEQIGSEETLSAEALTGLLTDSARLVLAHHPGSRLAWRPCGERAELFVDGQCYPCGLRLARALCHGAVSPEMLADADDRQLLLDLINSGSLYLDSDRQA